LIDLLTDGTVRMSTVIRSQPADKAAALITAVESAIERYQEDGLFKIPGRSHIGCGRQGVAVANCSSERADSPCDVGFSPPNLGCHVAPLGRVSPLLRGRFQEAHHQRLLCGVEPGKRLVMCRPFSAGQGLKKRPVGWRWTDAAWMAPEVGEDGRPASRLRVRWPRRWSSSGVESPFSLGPCPSEPACSTSPRIVRTR
jgi:hypothetical protein